MVLPPLCLNSVFLTSMLFDKIPTIPHLNLPSLPPSHRTTLFFPSDFHYPSPQSLYLIIPLDLLRSEKECYFLGWDLRFIPFNPSIASFLNLGVGTAFMHGIIPKYYTYISLRGLLYHLRPLTVLFDIGSTWMYKHFESICQLLPGSRITETSPRPVFGHLDIFDTAKASS